MTSSKGNKVANQFIITDEKTNHHISIFQSYNSVIVKQITTKVDSKVRTLLDADTWDYSKTTGKYRNIFLGETKAETQKKIDSGEYVLTDLNS
jgi:hypothetical protein